jgi:hypothetical protein
MIIITGVVQAFRALVFARTGENAKAISEVERLLTTRFAVDSAAVSSQARLASECVVDQLRLIIPGSLECTMLRSDPHLLATIFSD